MFGERTINQRMTKLLIKNYSISVQVNQHAIKIFNDDGLTALLQHNTNTSTKELISCIKQRYFEFVNVDFKVSNASMAVEIWAHVYVEKMAESIQRKFPLKIIRKLTDKIIDHCKEIDIGEWGHDYNRFVWDVLAVFKPVIALLFFRNK